MEKETRHRLRNIQEIPTQQIWEDGILSSFVFVTTLRSTGRQDIIH